MALRGNTHSKRFIEIKASWRFFTCCIHNIFLTYKNQLAHVFLVANFPHVNLKIRVEALIALFFENKNETIRFTDQIKCTVLINRLENPIPRRTISFLSKDKLRLTANYLIFLHLYFWIHL